VVSRLEARQFLAVNIKGGLLPSFFYGILSKYHIKIMEKDKLKLIVRNLELLVDSLKAEVYSDVDAYSAGLNPNEICGINDYDEIFEDDEG
tara:strand:- start:515 stop:787 length:273 start_codon:yes stop_codon:yes gene_type:complete